MEKDFLFEFIGRGDFCQMPAGVPFIFCSFCGKSIGNTDMDMHWTEHTEQFTEEQMRAFLSMISLGADFREAREQLFGDVDWHEFFNRVAG